jgi:hypothetical protein
VIAHRAMLDVPRELVRHLARLPAAERRAWGTRRGTRALTFFYRALLVLVWFRKAEDKTLLGAGFGVSRATAHRYVADGVAVLAAQAPDLHDALRRAADGGSPAILDGKLFDCDRLTVPLRVGARLVLLLSPYAVVNLLAVGVGALLLLVGFSVARRPRARLEVTSENAP